MTCENDNIWNKKWPGDLIKSKKPTEGFGRVPQDDITTTGSSDILNVNREELDKVLARQSAIDLEMKRCCERLEILQAQFNKNKNLASLLGELLITLGENND